MWDDTEKYGYWGSAISDEVVFVGVPMWEHDAKSKIPLFTDFVVSSIAGERVISLETAIKLHGVLDHGV